MLALGAGGLALSRTRPASAQALTTIRFGGSPFGETYYLPYFASDLGFFARAGLQVEFSNFTGAGLIIQAALGNAIDVGQCDVLGAANVYNRGFPLAYFAGGGMYSSDGPTTMLCTLPDSPIRTAKDLEGGAIGVPVLASISGLGVKAWLTANGADLNQIKFYELTYATMVPAMQRKDIVAGLFGEPNLTQVQGDKSVRILARPYDAIAKTFFVAATFASRPWLSANPDLARRVAQALDDAARWANAHHTESAVTVAKGTGIPLDIVNRMTRVRFGLLDARYVQPVLDAALKYKQLQKSVSAGDIMAKI